MPTLNPRRIHLSNRSGITLLATMSMIVLFMLLGTAFVMVSARFMRTAKYQAVQIEKGGDNPQTLLRRALMDVVRGQPMGDISAPMRGVDLLSDQYGYGFNAFVEVPNPVAAPGSGQLVTVDVRADSALRHVTIQNIQLSRIYNAYAGRVFTFVSGTAKNISTRVVGYEYLEDPHGTGVDVGRFYILPNWDEINSFNPFANVAVGDRVIINGRPFAGRGAGGLAGSLSTERDEAYLGRSALLPYKFGVDPVTLYDTHLITGVNESYDAPDFQNPFLAYESVDAGGNPIIISSFHHPKHVQHMLNNAPLYGLSAVGDMSPVSLRPGARPSSVDSNYWNPIWSGPEVDNDGDGVADSVWIDLGYPLQTDENGRTYKPLFAFKIIDLDGRLNVNAHGTTWDSQDNRQANPITMLGLADNTVNEFLPRGAGYGPPEISLSAALNPASYQALVASRYGNDGVPGGVNRDEWSWNKLFGHPGGSVGGFYSTAMDVFGRYAMGYPDAFGAGAAPSMFSANAGGVPYTMPSLDVDASFYADEISNSPYEMVLGNNLYTSDSFNINTTADVPFTAKEMERVLRFYDRDSRMLPGRLASILSSTLTVPYGDQLFTHASYEVPALPQSVNDLVDDLVEDNLGMTPTQLQRKVILMQLLSWDVMRGLPMDINRPFGNGVDDDSDGFVDEYGPTNSEQVMERLAEYYDGIADPNPNLNPFNDHDNDGVGSGDVDAYRARELYARNLYVLALAVLSGANGPVNNLMVPTYDINGDGNTDDEDIVAIAQWAINVVDFRDADSICTRFEFDLNPFDGWDTTTNPRVVYGAERPELLIMESFCIHERRTEDLSSEQPNAGETAETVGDNPDEDFDSRLMPRASAFVELYNPWTQDNANQVYPNELYRGSGGIDLDAVAPGGSPVWRLVFVKQTSIGIDPDDPTNTIPANDINRVVYFVDPGISGLGDAKARWTNLGVASIQPGQYAVIGSSGIQRDLGGGTFAYQTPISRRQSATEGDAGTMLLDTTRSITLIPDNNAVVMQKWVPTAGDIVSETRSNVVAIAVNQPRSLGLTEPVAGYNPLDPTGAPAVDVGDGLAYPTPYDTPEDYNSMDSAILETGITQDYNAVYLQRLANPLEAYNPNTNPFLTVDKHWVDLTAFNGVEDDSQDNMIPAPNPNQELRSVERGWKQGGKDPGDMDLVQTNRRQSRNIWQTEPQMCPIVNTPAIVGDDHIFNYPWNETFGLMNQWYQSTGAPADPNTEVVAFPWMAWNNRPFVSSMELTLVPFQRSSKMLDTFTLADEVNDPYTTGQQFGHLINFFSTNQNPNMSINFYRLLDYVEVPSRFVGTETYLNPNHFTGLTITAANPNSHAPLYGLNLPFNYVSRYRNPGKINLNTLAHNEVWRGLMGQPYADGVTINGTSPSGNPTTYGINAISFNNFLTNRTGMEAVTDFANPYRFSETSNFVPEYWDGGGWGDSLVVDGADCGLLRRSQMPTVPFYDVISNFPHSDTSRSAIPRYHARTRLDNLVTTRSSVYAIWITVGNFEVTHESDGSLMLRGELGNETGDIERHRSFYMVDRSIPVAFEPGEDHNVERMIIGENFIE